MKMPKKKLTLTDIAIMVVCTALVVLTVVGVVMSLDR